MNKIINKIQMFMGEMKILWKLNMKTTMKIKIMILNLKIDKYKIFKETCRMVAIIMKIKTQTKIFIKMSIKVLYLFQKVILLKILTNNHKILESNNKTTLIKNKINS